MKIKRTFTGMARVNRTAVERLGLTAEPGASGPVMLHTLKGFVDAGAVGHVAAKHLLDNCETHRIVTFNTDMILDYRSKRSLMTFETDRYTEYEQPFMVIDHLRDAEGTAFLLLHGMEPDLQWERLIVIIRQLIEQFGVTLTVGFHGLPMGVPHTRPLGLTAHGTRPGLTEDYTSFFGKVKVPSSLSALMELRLGEAGLDAMGFAVHIPHYFAQMEYAPGAVFALQHVERVTGLDLRTERLAVERSEETSELERQLRKNDDAVAVVTALEQQFDRFTAQVGTPGRLIDADGPIPTADELAAEFERFLAQQDGNQGEAFPTVGDPWQ
ncbi:MAG: PAC2 family protein [Cellulomonadaceae bacterium]|jgi:hypothetical protein|nr:PAC2 family protein [Cellulomonadaceae bacterium]